MELKCSKCDAEVAPDAGLEPGDSCPSCGAVLVRVRRRRARESPAKEPADAVEGQKGGLASEIERFGPYEIIEEVARGGMGVVYKAREKNLKRLVAIKVLLAGEGASEEEIRRFRREAEAASRLQHSNIVPIHTIGEVGGRHYFVMDFIEGKTVSDMIDDGELTPRMAVEITEQVADALHYAHQRGVIHRDMKPANIIIDHLGRPQIMDFGLAKQVDEDTGLTRSGTTMGTPAYMPPEQAEGDLAGIDAQSDVYALGAVLYEMLTGQPPFDGPTTMSILMKVLEEEPVAPGQVNPRIHRDIETICMKAMEKEKSRRYGSAKDLADDIRRFNAGEAIAAAPAGFFYVLWKKMLRNKEITAAVSAAFAALLVTLGWLAMRAHAEATSTQRDRERRFNQEIGAGNEFLLAGKAALEDTDTEAAEASFVKARDAFQRGLWVKPDDEPAKKRLQKAAGYIRQIKVDYYLRLGKKFYDQENYEAAQEMYRIVLQEYDRENDAAGEGMRRARGLCTLSLKTIPERATVYLMPVSFSAERPPKDLGRRLGETPIFVDDVESGTYRVTVIKEGYASDEFPVSLGRNELLELPGIELRPEADGAENMVRVKEGPVHIAGQTVWLKEFYIDRYEYPNRWGVRPTAEVSWIEAKRRCAERGKRLCTMNEWMRACQGDKEWPFPYGSRHQPNACYAGRPGPTARSAPAGTHVGCVSQFGAYDMSGNVAEWVVDRATKGALAAGGNWSQTLPSSLKCSSSLYYPPGQGWAKVGFRCCRGEGEGLKDAGTEDDRGQVPQPATPPAPPLPAAGDRSEKRCPKDMAFVKGSGGVSGFCIDRYEGPNRAGTMPETSVSWLVAKSRCQKRGMRLCRLDEWRLACGGPNGLAYPYGQTYVTGRCHAGAAAGAGARPSGSLPDCRSAWGVYDLSGNVAEWTSDAHPMGPGMKAYAGGGYIGAAFDVRCASSEGAPVSFKSSMVGYRCCAEPAAED